MTALDAFIAERGSSIVARTALSGGCIDTVERVDLEDGSSIVTKSGRSRDASRFHEEARGLSALRSTGTVRVPEVHGVYEGTNDCVLVIEHLPRGRESSPSAWFKFGQDLAALHAANVDPWSEGGAYGFPFDNHLGSTPQSNALTSSWCEFFREQRLRPLVDRARNRPDSNSAVLDDIERVADRLESWLDPSPEPALVHGDLWSGNALAVDEGGSFRIAVIDPAPSISDGLVDIAMMQLFGGFSSACFEAYFEARPAPSDVDRRIRLYQLHHVLNHVVIFGAGYEGQLRSLARGLA